jgi:hypothetical protein
MLHEVIESYEGGKIAQTTGVAAFGSPSEYFAAHTASTPQSGNVFSRKLDKNGIETNDPLDVYSIELYLKSLNKSEEVFRQITTSQ